MPNYLLWGASPAARENKARELLQEHLIHSIESLEKKGKIMKVEELRPFLPHWHVQPTSPWKRSGLLVLEAQRMNEEVQNTLLKILEEPPSFFTFVFTVPHPKLILPTVVSRCLITRVAGEYHVQNDQDLAEILRSEPGRRLEIFEEKIGYSREPVRAFLDDLEQQFADRPFDVAQGRSTPILKEIWETKKLLLDDSLNLKTAVDHFLLSW